MPVFQFCFFSKQSEVASETSELCTVLSTHHMSVNALLWFHVNILISDLFSAE